MDSIIPLPIISVSIESPPNTYSRIIPFTYYTTKEYKFPYFNYNIYSNDKTIIPFIYIFKGVDFLFNLLVEILSNVFYFALHVTGAGSFPPPLSAKKETELLEKSRNGYNDARNKLIEHNLRLVAHIVKKYYSAFAEQDDLISIGTIGLIKAVETFKSDKGIRLATYAARCIENAIYT